MLIAAMAAGTILLAGSLLLSRCREDSARVLLPGILALSAIDLYPVGTTIWDATAPFSLEQRRPLNSSKWYGESFALARDKTPGLALGPRYSVLWISYWYFDRTGRFFDWAAWQRERPTEILLGMVDARRLFFSGRIAHRSIAEYLRDTRPIDAKIIVAAYNGDRLRVSVDAPIDGYLSFIDNWDPDWQVFVDGNEQPVLQLFGTFKAVSLLAGHHRVEFAYRPLIFGWRLGSLDAKSWLSANDAS